MLKIKDNVDLKVLENYGFKLEDNLCYEKDFTAVCYDGDEKHHMYIYLNTREIVLDIMNNDYTYHNWDDEIGRIEDMIFDLTQAGLVEKVDSKMLEDSEL